MTAAQAEAPWAILGSLSHLGLREPATRSTASASPQAKARGRHHGRRG